MQVPGPFEYERASSVDHAIGLLGRLGDGAMIVAGGHSLLPMLKLRIANPEYLVDNPSRRCPDVGKARRELGYTPEVSLDEGLRRSLLWYSQTAGAGARS